MTLYKEDENPLLNDFGCYIPDSLHTFQNMQEFSRDIDEYVSHSTTLEDGTIINRFSKELLAYLKILVASHRTTVQMTLNSQESSTQSTSLLLTS